MAVKLTYAETETLAEIWNNGIYVGDLFDAIRIFPARDNADNAHRRTCERLAKKGVIEKVVQYPGQTGCYRITQESKGALSHSSHLRQLPDHYGFR